MKPINKFLLSCFLLLSVSAELFAQIPIQYNNTYEVYNALKYRNKGLTLVCSHRGNYRGTNNPENSRAAFLSAASQNVDLIEIDVRNTSDGIPVLSHDETVGRLVWGFNTDNKNYRIDQVTWNNLNWRELRTEYGEFKGETVASFEQILQMVRNHKLKIVILLDIKDVWTAQKCWEITKRYSNAWGAPAHDWVVFKMNPYLFRNPGDLEYKMNIQLDYWKKRFKYIPAFSTGVHFSNPSPISVYRDYRWRPYFTAIEVEIKEWNRRLQNLVNDVKNSSNDGLVVFQPVPEVRSNEYYDGKTGRCCQRLSQHFAKGNLPDTDDKRPDLNFLYQQGFSCIITDKFANAANFLRTKGKRNTCAIRSGCRTSNEEELAASEEGAYPNPTDGAITLSLQTDSAGTAQLSLFDLQGKNVLVKSELLQTGTNEVALDLKAQGAKPGIYMLQAIFPNQRRKTFKIVVQ